MEGTSTLSHSHQSKKNMRQDADRLSSLPDSLIHHIFSYLDMKEVVQTSLLSTTWKHIWQSVSYNLSFDHSFWKNVEASTKIRNEHLDYGNDFDEYDRPYDYYYPYANRRVYGGSNVVLRKHGYMEFVDRFLLHPKNPTLNKLSLNCGEFWEISRINRWMRAAVKLHVREMYLEAYNRPASKSSNCRRLPKVLFTEDITKFKLKSKFIPVGRVRFGKIRLPKSVGLATQLRLLELESVQLPDGDSKGEFKLKCPVLENLVLSNCDHQVLNLLQIHALKLKTLVIQNNDARWVGHCKIKICAPELTSFNLQGFFYKYYDVDDLPSVIDANVRVGGGANIQQSDLAFGGRFNFQGVGSDEDNQQYSRVQHLVDVLKCISSARTLELQNWSLEPHNFHDVLDVMPDAFWNLRSLKLTWGGTSCMQVMTDLLKCSQIESLVLQVTKASSTEKDGEKDVSFKWIFSNLKFVEIKNFMHYENERRLLKTLIENGTVLQKVTLGLSQSLLRHKQKEVARVSQWLLSLPRASSGFKIRFRE